MVHTMNETSKLRLLLAGSVGAAVISAAIRILLTLTCFDAYYGVYEHGAVLPTVYHVFLLLLLAGLCVGGVLFPQSASRTKRCRCVTALSSFPSSPVS